MHWWSPSMVEQIEDALTRAASGTPTVLLIRGQAGAGKSSLLREVIDRATSFRVSSAENRAVTVAPLGVLAQWGVATASNSDTLIAHELRDFLDRAAPAGPLLLTIDDVQWADPESMDALVAVLARTFGDHLLVAAATRPLPAGRFASWQHWTGEHAMLLELTGLGVKEASAMLRAVRPDIDEQTIGALRAHTDGNPLYLRALVNEFEVADLARSRPLPAPQAFAQRVGQKLNALPDDCQPISAALAVLGNGWSSVFDVATLADVPTPLVGLQHLVDADLVSLRRLGSVTQVRPAHALIQAAIYQRLPLARRSQLHARAAGLVSERADRLRHRIAAAEHHDEALAADLEALSGELHRAGSHRLAGEYLQSASTLTPHPDVRERRWLDSLYEGVLAYDLARVRAELGEATTGSGAPRRALVEGALAVYERRPHEAVRILAEPLEEATPGIEAAVRYRMEILLAWARLTAGAPTGEIGRALGRAEPLEPKDAAVASLAALTQGCLGRRQAGGEANSAVTMLSALPADARHVPAGGTAALAWRGSMAAVSGRFAPALVDLGEVVERMTNGSFGAGSGGYHALLARAQWFSGHWSLAQLNLRLAVELAPVHVHPLTVAVRPLLATGRGDLERADAELDDARALLRQTPWMEAVDLLFVTEVAREHLKDAPSSDLYAQVSGDVSQLRGRIQAKNQLWVAHAGVAALWASQFDDVQFCIDLLQQEPQPGPLELPWRAPLVHWLSGLLAEAHGQARAAVAHLRAATDDAGSHRLPLYRAHILSDLARLDSLVGERDRSAAAHNEALALYRSLGARAYVARSESIRADHHRTGPGEHVGLSDREHDVLTLVSAGMSYAQIARRLFITRSTVSFHLGRIYAKAEVRTRHELTELVLRDPELFGLSRRGGHSSLGNQAP